MARAGTAISDVLRIEDEVWQEAFATRIPRRRGHEEPIRRERIALAHPDAAHPLRPQPGAATPAPRPEPTAKIATPARATASSPAVGRSVAEGVTERRTVTIKGRGAERNLPWPGDQPRRRPSRPVHARAGFRPDRLAMWAMFLGLLLVLVAVLSAHG